MIEKRLDTLKACDKIVCNWVQQFEDVNFRIQATLHVDMDCGDEFITLYDPQTDVCLTVWRTPAWYGNDVLKLARSIIAPQLKGLNVSDDDQKGGVK